MKTTKPMLEYLATCSKVSLESFELARLNDRANLRKHMIELLDELIEVDIQARVAEWILTHRRRQAEVRSSRRIRRNSSAALKGISLPLFSAENANEDGASVLSALEASPVMPALVDAVLDSPTALHRSATSLPEKSRRIA
jgi:hypothetical protein